MNLFKAYDIRGIYPIELNEKLTEKIGYNFGRYILKKKGKVVVGYDMRPHSLPLKNAYIQGLRKAGQDIILIGLCSTPMMNFATSFLKAIGGTIITASHNSKEWNGLKFCGKNSLPISYDNGINKIEEMMNKPIIDNSTKTKISHYDISRDYVKHIHHQVNKFSKKSKIVVDYANAMGIKETEAITDYFDIIPLFDKYDGNFPNHEANPLKISTLVDLQKAVLANKASFGAALDGDADRCGFVDEKGIIIPMDLISTLFAQEILQSKKGTIIYDVRSSRILAEIVKSNGGTAIKSAVGHSHMKKAMRDHQALFGGELSGHYYFCNFSNCESQAFAILLLGKIIDTANKPLSKIIAPLRKYEKSEEINFKVINTKKSINNIKNKFKNFEQESLDGLTVNAADWWFNIRSSNTEPLLRVNIEANNIKMLNDLIKRLSYLIQN